MKSERSKVSSQLKPSDLNYNMEGINLVALEIKLVISRINHTMLRITLFKLDLIH
jgi:hypothetical protein